MSQRGPRFLAIANGDRHYWTGKPCKNGHLSLRLAENGACLECRRKADRLKYAQNPQAGIEKMRAFYQKNAEAIRARRRARYAENPDTERKYARIKSAEWRRNNPEKLKQQAPLKKAYKLANPHKAAALVIKRRAARKNRMPCWLSKDDFWAIEEFYDLAARRTKATGIAWHVDHIYPLQGNLVSGLHVPWNLQVIPWYENVRKGNKMPSDVVSALGNGSTKAGSDKLYKMMHEIRSHARSSQPKELPPPAKNPLDYLKDSRKARR